MVEDNSTLLGGRATILASSSRADRVLLLCCILRGVLCLWQASSCSSSSRSALGPSALQQTAQREGGTFLPKDPSN